jgi:hypothetical protein
MGPTSGAKELARRAAAVYSDWTSCRGEKPDIGDEGKFKRWKNQQLAAGLDYNDGTVAVDQRFEGSLAAAFERVNRNRE